MDKSKLKYTVEGLGMRVTKVPKEFKPHVIENCRIMNLSGKQLGDSDVIARISRMTPDERIKLSHVLDKIEHAQETFK